MMDLMEGAATLSPNQRERKSREQCPRQGPGLRGAAVPQGPHSLCPQPPADGATAQSQSAPPTLLPARHRFRRCAAGSAAAPRRPGLRAGGFFAMAVCIPEGTNRARALLRDWQALTWRGPWIQLGSSEALTNAAENTIWPVSRPWEAAAVASHVWCLMGSMRAFLLLPRCTRRRDSSAASTSRGSDRRNNGQD